MGSTLGKMDRKNKAVISRTHSPQKLSASRRQDSVEKEEGNRSRTESLDDDQFFTARKLRSATKSDESTGVNEAENKANTSVKSKLPTKRKIDFSNFIKMSNSNKTPEKSHPSNSLRGRSSSGRTGPISSTPCENAKGLSASESPVVRNIVASAYLSTIEESPERPPRESSSRGVSPKKCNKRPINEDRSDLPKKRKTMMTIDIDIDITGSQQQICSLEKSKSPVAKYTKSSTNSQKSSTGPLTSTPKKITTNLQNIVNLIKRTEVPTSHVSTFNDAVDELCLVMGNGEHGLGPVVTSRRIDGKEPESTTIEKRQKCRPTDKSISVGSQLAATAASPKTQNIRMETELKNWLLITIHSPEIANELEIMKRKQIVEKEKFLDLFLGAVNDNIEYSGLPFSLQSKGLEPFACRVKEVSSWKDPQPYLLATRIPFDNAQKSKDTWKVLLRGVMAPCLAFTIKKGNTVIFYGGVVNRQKQLVLINFEQFSEYIYVFNHCCKAQAYPENDGFNTVIYDSKEVFSDTYVSYKPNTSKLCQTVVVMQPARKTSSNTDVNLAERSKEGTSQYPETSLSTSAAGRMATNQSTNNNALVDPGNGHRESAAAEGEGSITFNRIRRSPPRVEDDEMERIDENEIQNMSYSDWIARGIFVPGNQRQKIKKKKGNHEYNTLRELHNKLNNEIKTDYIKRGAPRMQISSQCYMYGIVTDDNSQNKRKTYFDAYDIRISDETVIGDEDLDNVPVRICASNMYTKIGPPIKIGQVIRIHRATVQVEYDKFRNEHTMVISTAPHLNYTLFFFDEKSERIIYDSVAKHITLTDDDQKRAFDLLKFFHNRQNESASQEAESIVSVPEITRAHQARNETQEPSIESVFDQDEENRVIDMDMDITATDDGENFHNSEVIQESPPVLVRPKRRRNGSFSFHRSPPPSPI